MTDHLTACLATEEATVKAFLTTHGHTYVKTLGPFTNGDLILNTITPPAQPSACGGDTRAGTKVVVHTTEPN